MAKRINLQKTIEGEIEKGNIYVMENGNFVSADNLEKGILDDFKRGLTDGSIAITTSLEQYKQEYLNGLRKAEDLLSHINNFFTVGEGESNC